MKIVINKCYGGFGLSNGAMLRYLELKGVEFGMYTVQTSPFCYVKLDKSEINRDSDCGVTVMLGPQQEMREYNDDDYFYYADISRDDPILVQVVEELGSKANGVLAELKIVEIPDDVDWYVSDYNGIETVEEIHRTWR